MTQRINGEGKSAVPLNALLSDIDNILCRVKSPFPLNFLSKIEFRADGCWMWKGAFGFHPRHRQHRYGEFKVLNPLTNKRHSTTAHRFAYQCVHGPVARSLDIDHLCGNKLCVNPEHLEAVTHRENIQRMYDRRAK